MGLTEEWFRIEGNRMNELAGLWIPIVVSAVAVLLACFSAREVFGLHHCDWKDLPEEEVTVEQLQKSGVGPGMYVFPGRRKKLTTEDEELRQQRRNSGPWGTINIRTRHPSLGRHLLQMMTFSLVTSLFVGYLGTLALNPGAEFLQVFQVTGTAGILAYAFGGIPNAIWFGSNLRGALMDVVDGLCFGVITGAVFGILWPA